MSHNQFTLDLLSANFMSKTANQKEDVEQNSKSLAVKISTALENPIVDKIHSQYLQSKQTINEIFETGKRNSDRIVEDIESACEINVNEYNIEITAVKDQIKSEYQLFKEQYKNSIYMIEEGYKEAMKISSEIVKSCKDKDIDDMIEVYLLDFTQETEAAFRDFTHSRQAIQKSLKNLLELVKSVHPVNR